MHLNARNNHQQHGFTLIEVLIATFVLAVGILGVAGLQLFAKQSNYEAIQRATASQLATSIVERMRVNYEARTNYAVTGAPIPATAIPTTCTSTVKCNPTELATKDINTWYSALIGGYEQSADNNNIGGLISPSACITEIADDSEYRIAIVWRGRSPLSNPTVDNCGVDAAVGGTKIYGDNNEYRRLFVMEATFE